MKTIYIYIAAALLAPCILNAQTDTTESINALDYSLQKRYRPVGEPFVSERFSDNTFLSAGAGAEQLFPRGNSVFSWGAAARVSYGKWINASNALRLSLAFERMYRGKDNGNIANAGFDISHLFNLNSYFGGYKPSRFFEVSTVEGLRYRCSFLGGDVSNNIGVHLGFNLNMRLTPRMDFFVEPLVMAYTDGIDHSGKWNWHKYDLGVGGTMGLSYNLHSDRTVLEKGESHGLGSFVSLSAGPQFQNSDMVHEMGIFRSMGFHLNFSYGKWFSRVFALRTSCFFSMDKWVEHSDGNRDNCRYIGGRIEGMLDIWRLITGNRESIFSLPVLFGPEIAGMSKDEQDKDISRFYLGLTGGLQLKCRVRKSISVFLEPRFSVIPYYLVPDTADPLKRVGGNYFDSVYNLNLGVEFNLSAQK